MPVKPDVYLFGMTILSTIHRLSGDYPEPDTYQEIAQTHVLPGGETGNAAILLARLGLKVRSDGTLLGRETREFLLRFNRGAGVDCSGMRYDPKFEGWKDLVLSDGRHRTVFGWYQRMFSDKGGKKWTPPDASALRAARVVSIDPFFQKESEQAALLCAQIGKKYVTIDCGPDSVCHRHSAVNVVSQEFIHREFKGADNAALLRRYVKKSRGMTIFTFGARDLWYARQEGGIRRFTPFKVDVKGTLGAGDSFRAGILYGLFRGWEDSKTIRFGAALAACVCRCFPVALHPPSLGEVVKLMKTRKA